MKSVSTESINVPKKIKTIVLNQEEELSPAAEYLVMSHRAPSTRAINLIVDAMTTSLPFLYEAYH